MSELAERRVATLGATPALVAAPGQFDGAWLLKLTCSATEGGAAGFQRGMWITIRNSALHGESGTKGQPNYLALDGEVQPDGIALLTAAGLTGAPRVHPRAPAAGDALFVPCEGQVRADTRHRNPRRKAPM